MKKTYYNLLYAQQKALDAKKVDAGVLEVRQGDLMKQMMPYHARAIKVRLL